MPIGPTIAGRHFVPAGHGWARSAGRRSPSTWPSWRAPAWRGEGLRVRWLRGQASLPDLARRRRR